MKSSRRKILKQLLLVGVSSICLTSRVGVSKMVALSTDKRITDLGDGLCEIDGWILTISDIT